MIRIAVNIVRRTSKWT